MVATNTHMTRCGDNRFYRKITLLLVIIFVFFMVVISIAWLVMHPHDPGFRVTSLSVTNFALSESQVLGRYEVGLTITNPNKIKTQVVLLHFVCLRLYDQLLSEAAVQRQQQRVFLEKLTNMSVKVDFEVRDQHKVVPQVLREDLNKGVVNFKVVLKVKVRFEAGIWPSKDKILDVSCEDLDVEFHSQTKDTGKLLGIGKNCSTKNAAGRA
ncbi:hypothetical protein PHAVU_011G098100 [Phaseolus vulgaris]|uniref:Late embryogenesis abundant protein LEA-2 subgroup domain-containing protein n=2 Tax=Phaseolus vulgaris TaxID=3885 RepID=V7AGS8_PHAVU|nr:hypothetical protein PHAVU_011G098100g [Phaseolus vulgaris]ESW04480.1 hypothetical protein PHAVU_011G098100g [Phaseolus vulgaris]